MPRYVVLAAGDVAGRVVKARGSFEAAKVAREEYPDLRDQDVAVIAETRVKLWPRGWRLRHHAETREA